jgi:hypothetical protein
MPISPGCARAQSLHPVRAHWRPTRPQNAPHRPQYEADSAPALALNATIDRTNKRFANYAKAGLLCGTDGLPHLIADPGLALKYGHAGEIFVSISRVFGLTTRARSMKAVCVQLRRGGG